MKQLYSSDRRYLCKCYRNYGAISRSCINISNGMYFVTRPIDFSVDIPYLELLRRKRFPITYEGEIIEIVEVFYCLNCGRITRIRYDNPIVMKKILENSNCNNYLGKLYAGNEFIGGLYGRE